MAKADARAKLIEVATSLFVERSYDGVSVREICTAAGTTSNMIHHYFGSKEGLYKEIISQFSADVFMGPIKLLSRTPQTAEEFRSLLEIFLDQTLDALIEHRHVYTLARRERVKSDSMMAYQTAFVAFMEAGKVQGLVREQVDAGMITGLIIGRLISQVEDADWIKEVTGTDIVSDEAYRRRWMSANVDIFLHGLSA